MFLAFPILAALGIPLSPALIAVLAVVSAVLLMVWIIRQAE
jgi:hypothetical protein